MPQCELACFEIDDAKLAVAVVFVSSVLLEGALQTGIPLGAVYVDLARALRRYELLSMPLPTRRLFAVRRLFGKELARKKRFRRVVRAHGHRSR